MLISAFSAARSRPDRNDSNPVHAHSGVPLRCLSPRLRASAVRFWAALFILACATASAQPRLHYSKSFPGSVPAFVDITLEKSGDGLYREAVDDDNPLKFKLAESETAAIFDLVPKLDYFKRSLDSNLKVAFMGMKTFQWEDGGKKTEAKFNYSEDATARTLADWFERITESELHYIDLERAAKYDKLGVLKALLQLESAMDRKRLVAATQYLPLLDRIIKNESYMHAARTRASGIAEAIRGGGAPAPGAPAATPAP